MESFQTNPNANLSVKSVYPLAWRLLKGVKRSIWLTGLSGGVVLLILLSIANHSFGIVSGAKLPMWYQLAFLPLLMSVVLAPFIGGVNGIAIKRARGEAMHPWQGFKYFDRSVNLLLASLISLLVTTSLPALGLYFGETAAIVLRVVSLFLSIFLLFMIPLIVDRNVPVGTAFLQSIKCIANRYFAILINYLIFFVAIIIISYGYLALVKLNQGFAALAIVVVFAMVWLLPFGAMMLAVMYTRLVE